MMIEPQSSSMHSPTIDEGFINPDPVSPGAGPAAFTGTTHIAAVLDKSGSMGTVRRETIGGFNSWLAGMKTTDTEGTPIRFTLTLFDTAYSTPIKDAPIAKVNPLDESRYRPHGSTALLDATADAVRAMPDNGKDRYLVVILTDGEENASCHTTKEDLAALIAEKEATGRWTFAYLSAGMDAFGDAASIGIAVGNTQSYTGDEVGTQDAFHSVTMSVRSYSRSGHTASASLFAGQRHAGGTGADSASGSTAGPAKMPRASKPSPSAAHSGGHRRSGGNSDGRQTEWVSGGASTPAQAAATVSPVPATVAASEGWLSS